MNMLGIIGGQELIVIALIVLVLFGGKKIPELMKGLGKGVKEYKKAVNGIEEEVNGVAGTVRGSAAEPDSEAAQPSGRTQDS